MSCVRRLNPPEREFADFLAPGRFPDFCAQKSRDFFHIHSAHLRISILRLTVIFSSFSNIRQIKKFDKTRKF